MSDIKILLISSKIFINPETGNVWQEGDTYKRENLGYTLMEIAKNGVDEFYSGETARKLVKDIQDAGGIITLDDLKSYRYLTLHCFEAISLF